MKQKNLAILMKVAIIMLGVVGLVCFGDIIPIFGKDLADKYPEFSYCFWPWCIFLELLIIPYYLVLVMGWIVSGNIAKDKSFSYVNANKIKSASIICLTATIYFFVGNVLLALLSMSHPGILLLSFICDFVGIALSVGFGLLSHLIYNAAKLQEQNDLTI